MSTRNNLIIDISTYTVTYKGWYICFKAIRPSFWLLIVLLDNKSHSRISIYKKICSKVKQNSEYVLTMQAIVSYLKKYESLLVYALDLLEIPLIIQKQKSNKGYGCKLVYNKILLNIQIKVSDLDICETIALKSAKKSFLHKDYEQCTEILESNIKFGDVYFINTANLYLFLSYIKLNDFAVAAEYADKIIYILLDKDDQVIYDKFLYELTEKK